MLDRLSQTKPWAAAVHSDSSTSLARDFKALHINLAQCRACTGRWFAVSCMAEAFNRFMAPRFVSTLLLVAAAFTALAVLA